MKGYLALVTLFAILGMSAVAFANPGDTLWTRIYGGGDIDVANAVIQTRDGGYLMAGATQSFGNGGYDAYLVKTDSYGDMVWEYAYGSAFDDGLSSVMQSPYGGYIAAGFTRPDSAHMDFYLLWVDSLGELIWANTYGGAGDDYATHVEMTLDNRYIICGWSDSYSQSRDVLVIKVDPDGDGTWTHRSDGIADEGAYCIRPTAEGNYILTGFTSDSDGPNIYVEKISGGGADIWNQEYQQGFESQGYSLVAADDTTYVIAGYAYNGPTYVDAHLMKINSNGGIVWSRNFGGSDREVANCVATTPDSGFIMAGYKMHWWPLDSCVAYLVRTDAAGNLVWQSILDLGTFSYARCVAPTSDGNYIVAGGCNLYDPVNYNCFLAKVQGENALSADNGPFPPSGFDLGPIYPNPFNACVTIDYSTETDIGISLEIYDILGHRVACLADDPVRAGRHTVKWQAEGLPSGIYLVRLRTGESFRDRKIVLMK